jgi:heme exporter protein B
MAHLWWILQKDLTTEFRCRRAWPTMMVLGIVVALVFSLQMNLLPRQKQQLVGGLLWLAIFFAGMAVIDRSISAEREDGCWDGLRMYPVSSTAVYLAKLLTNCIALGALQCLLIPLFFVLSSLPLGEHLRGLLLISVLGNLGLTSLGTLLSGLATTMGRSGSLLTIVVLPLVIPVVLGAAEATRLLFQGADVAMWWRWIQLLTVFSVVFITAGLALFDLAIQE